ncbi:MAG: hypothetical protein WAO98_05490 [Alphaproteobacteria bacterium]
MSTPVMPLAPLFQGQLPEEQLALLRQQGSIGDSNEYDSFLLALGNLEFTREAMHAFAERFSYRQYIPTTHGEWATAEYSTYQVFKNPFTEQSDVDLMYEFRRTGLQVTFRSGTSFLVLDPEGKVPSILDGEIVPNSNDYKVTRVPGNASRLIHRYIDSTDMRQAALMYAALRYHMGIDADADSAKALRITELLCLNPKTTFFIKTTALNLRDAIKRETKFRDASSSNETEASTVAEMVRGIHYNQYTYANLAQEISEKSRELLEIVADRLLSLDRLYSLDGRELSNPLVYENSRQRTFFTQCIMGKILGADPEQLILSTSDFGPIYNRINTQGFLIPGDFSEQCMPLEGYGKLLGLKGTHDGEIDFRFEQPLDGKFYLTQQDVDVVLALAFADDKPITPSLSMDYTDPRTPMLAQKVWSPEWVGNTDLGKTFYAADYWMGRICFYNEELPILEAVQPQFREAATDILSEMKSLNGSASLNIRPLKIEWTWKTNKKRHWFSTQTEYQCAIRNVAMGILSKLSENKEGFERKGSREWGTKESGHSVIFNARYEEIAGMWPVFERQRQLVTLIRALEELRAKGFKPSPALSARIQNIKQSFTSQPSLKRENRLVLWS